MYLGNYLDSKIIKMDLYFNLVFCIYSMCVYAHTHRILENRELSHKKSKKRKKERKSIQILVGIQKVRVNNVEQFD